MSEAGDSVRPNETTPGVVQIKPEPSDIGFERLQQDIRHERSQQSFYAASVLRRPMEYPIMPETSQQAMDMNRRDKMLPLPLDYPIHAERNMVQNHEGPEPVQTEYLQNNERNREMVPSDHSLNLMEQSTGREPERDGQQLPTSESGFFKMTTSSSGMTLVSRQTANRCPVCNRIFHYYSSFNRHMKLHQGVFTHICEVCRRKFTRKEHFVRHKCHRRPNKPSRMADLNEGDTSLGVSGEPLVQPPPTSNEPSPREVSIPPPLIHISDMPTTNMSAQRNAFTYDPHPFSESSLVPISTHMDTTPIYSMTTESERPIFPVEPSTNNKHRRKTTTPMKVEAFMEPPPSLDPQGEMSMGRSTEDIPDTLEKSSPGHSTTDCPTVTNRRASSSDVYKVSSAAGEFGNISRPESRNSEPTQSSHYGNCDPPHEQDEKNFSERPINYPGPLRDDQYPVLKRKVLEAASSLSNLENDMNNCNNGEDEGRKGSQSREGSEGQGSVSEQYAGSGGLPHDDDMDDETQPTDLSATGTPTGQLSQGPSPSGPDTASTTGANTPTGFVPTPPSSDAAPTPSSAIALSPYSSQPGEGQGVDLMDQHISSQGPVKETSLNLNTSLSMSSAYATSEPSSPAASAKQQQQQQQGDIHCPSCSKKFLHLSSLNRHMKLHQGIFTHACAVCGRKFTRKEHFVNHKCSRRPRNPSRVMAAMEQESIHGQPQKVEYPPSMALPKQPSPPGAATWDAGSLSMSSGGGIASPLASPLASPIPLASPLMPQPGPSISSENNSSNLPPSSPEHRRMWKWKSKWQ